MQMNKGDISELTKAEHSDSCHKHIHTQTLIKFNLINM